MAAAAAALLVLLGGCSGDTESEAQPTIPTVSASSSGSTESEPESNAPDASPESTAPPTAEPAVPAVKADPADYTDALGGSAFLTPSKNIVCFIRQMEVDGMDEWGCLIKKYSYTDPGDPSMCPFTYGGGFASYFGGELEVLCRGESIVHAETGEGTVLPHGSSVTIGQVTCASAAAGVTCTDNRNSQTLFLSEKKYEIS